MLGEPLARRAAATDVEVVQRLAERSGARFVVPGEQEWATVERPSSTALRWRKESLAAAVTVMGGDA